MGACYHVGIYVLGVRLCVGRLQRAAMKLREDESCVVDAYGASALLLAASVYCRTLPT
jgi:hypothetical protein